MISVSFEEKRQKSFLLFSVSYLTKISLTFFFFSISLKNMSSLVSLSDIYLGPSALSPWSQYLGWLGWTGLGKRSGTRNTKSGDASTAGEDL